MTDHEASFLYWERVRHSPALPPVVFPHDNSIDDDEPITMVYEEEETVYTYSSDVCVNIFSDFLRRISVAPLAMAYSVIMRDSDS